MRTNTKKVKHPKRGRRTGPDTIADGDWLAGAVEVPRAGTEATATLATRQKWYRRVIWACLAMLVVTVLVLIGLTGRIATLGAAEKSTGGTRTDVSQGRVAATAHLEKWLSGDPSPLPGGKIISWDGAVDVPVPTKESALEDTKYDFDLEIDTFTIVNGNGQAFKASVHVAVDPRGGAKVLHGPSLEAVIPPAEDSWVPVGPWPGREPTQVPDAVREAVEGWAGAYTSGSSSALRLAVGDPDPGHTYIPLSGVTSVDVETSAAYAVWGEEGRPKDSTVPPQVLVVRATLGLSWQESQDEVGYSRTAAPVVMDLLVERADTAAPVVTAWGAAGEGPLLERYQNAVDAEGRGEQTAPVPQPSKDEPKDEESSGEPGTKDKESPKDEPSTNDQESPQDEIEGDEPTDQASPGDDPSPESTD